MLHAACAHLFTAFLADHSPMVELSPELVFTYEKLSVVALRTLAERPREDLVLVILLVFLHVVRQVPANGVDRPRN